MQERMSNGGSSLSNSRRCQGIQDPTRNTNLHKLFREDKATRLWAKEMKEAVNATSRFDGQAEDKSSERRLITLGVLPMVSGGRLIDLIFAGIALEGPGDS